MLEDGTDFAKEEVKLPLTRIATLVHNAVLVLDAFTAIYVWAGKYTSPALREFAVGKVAGEMLLAEEVKQSRPAWAKVQQIEEGIYDFTFDCLINLILTILLYFHFHFYCFTFYFLFIIFYLLFFIFYLFLFIIFYFYLFFCY